MKAQKEWEVEKNANEMTSVNKNGKKAKSARDNALFLSLYLT